jgi:hypothetical protein
MRTRSLMILLSLTAVGLSPVPSLLSPIGMDAAYAGNGHGSGKGQGGGKGADKTKKEKSTRSTKVRKTSNGAIASELKGLNAYHASATAFENAAPNSQVGRLAAYRDAALAAQDAEGAIDVAGESLGAANQALTDAQTALDNAVAAGATQEEIDALQGAVDRAATDVETAQGAYDDALANAAEATLSEEEALLEASNGRILTRGTIEYLREKLGITASPETSG